MCPIKLRQERTSVHSRNASHEQPILHARTWTMKLQKHCRKRPILWSWSQSRTPTWQKTNSYFLRFLHYYILLLVLLLSSSPPSLLKGTTFIIIFSIYTSFIAMYITFTINWIWIWGYLHKTVFPNRLVKGMILNTFDLYNKLWTKSF